MKHNRLRRKQFRGLRHERHAAEDNHGRAGLLRLDAQFERVADEVRHILNLRRDIVVREYHRAALALQHLNVIYRIHRLIFYFNKKQRNKEIFSCASGLIIFLCFLLNLFYVLRLFADGFECGF